MITFLADESFPDPTADLIQSWGYTVKKAREDGLSGAKDSHVFEVAQRAGWVLLTDAVLQKLLAETREEEYLGTLFIVDRNKYRKRKRP
jgi:predicted nuclease of predicted toxin-antitoxin system